MGREFSDFFRFPFYNKDRNYNAKFHVREKEIYKMKNDKKRAYLSFCQLEIGRMRINQSVKLEACRIANLDLNTGTMKNLPVFCMLEKYKIIRNSQI